MQVLYDLAVRLSINYGGFSSGATTAMGTLSRLQGQMTAAGATSAKLNRSLGLLAAGMALTGAGMAGVGMLRGWVTAAGTMQEALAQVGIVAKGTQGQLANLVNQSYTVANATQFSAPQVLLAESVMGQLGFRDPSGKQTPRQVIGGAIADFMRGAEVAQHFQHTNYQAAVTAMSQMAHQFGTYSGAGLARNVALEIGASLASGMSLSEQANVVKYLTPAMKTMGVSPQDALALVAVAHQTGLTMGKGGSNLGALLRGFAPTGAPKHDHALAAMEHFAGGAFYNTQGEFVGIPTAMRLLNRFYDNHIISNEKRGVIAKIALGVQGSTAAAVLGNNTSILQYNAMRGQLGGDTPAWLTSVQKTLNNTLQGQQATLQGNLGSIASLLGAPLLSPVGALYKGFVQLTGAIVSFLVLHPGVAAFITTFAAVAAGAALIAGPILVAAGAFGILSAAGIVTAGAFLPFTAVVVGVVAAVAGATWVFTHWGQVVRVLNDPLGAMTGHMGGVAQALLLLFAPTIAIINGFRLLWEWGSKLVTWAGGFGGIAKTVGGAFGAIAAAVAPLVLMFQQLLTWADGFRGVGRTIGDALGIAFQPIGLAIDAIKKLMTAYQSLMDKLHPALRTKVTEPFAYPGANTSAGAKGHSWATAGSGGGWGTPPYTRPVTHPLTRMDHPRTIATPPRSGWEWMTGVHARTTETFVHHHPVIHPVPHHTPAPPLIPRKTGGMALIGAGSLQASRTIEVHHHHHGSPVSIAINGADHATSNDLAAVVAKRVRHEITASARWHNRYHGKGMLGMEPT